MRYVAEREHCSVELVRSELAAGRHHDRHVRRHFRGSMADHETQKPHGRAYRHSGARDLSGGTVVLYRHIK